MKNKVPYLILIVLLSTVIYSCKEKIHTDFSYEPEMPKIGDSVYFTNLSAGGEDFDWTFRNNATSSVTRSILKNPIRVFTTPGEYSVTLRVDSNDNNVRTKSFYVYDSIPSIAKNKAAVGFYNDVTFSAIAYNPLNRVKTYQWYFSLNAEGDSLRLTEDGTMKTATAPEPIVYFTEKEVTEIVKLHMTIGDSIYTTEQIPPMTFTIEDVKTRSLLMAKKDGNVLRQRIFEKGVDVVEDTGIAAGAHPFNIVSSGEQLFIFDAGSNIEEISNWKTDTNGDGSIQVVNLKTNVKETVISNAGTSSYFGFYNGYVDGSNVYWTDRNDFVYQTPKTTRNQVFEWKDNEQDELPYYVTRAESLSHLGLGQGLLSGGIYFYDNLYYWAKGGAGKGIYRFEKENLSNTFRVILPEYSIRAFAYDRNNRQIYFSSTDSLGTCVAGFYVSNIDGLEVRKIDSAPIDDASKYITGIVIDSDAKKVLWAYRAPEGLDGSGIKQIKIVRSDTEKPEPATYFNKEEGIYGITLDDNLR